MPVKKPQTKKTVQVKKIVKGKQVKPITKKIPLIKKRGKRAEKIVEYDNSEKEDTEASGDESSENESEDESENESEDNSPPVIVKLAMDTSKFKKLQDKKNEKKGKTKSTAPRKLSDSVFENDIPKDLNCNVCSKLEKENSFLKKKIENLERQSKISKGNLIVVNKPKIFCKKDGKKFVFEPTNIVCRNDMEPFDNVPCPLIEGYDDLSGKFWYSTLFCSIGCALYHNQTVLNDAHMWRRKSLTIHVFKLMMGDAAMDLVINSAPPLERLKKLGGDLTIKQYRKKCMCLNQSMIKYVPPMKPIGIPIEERVEEQREYDDDEYVLKRTKPLNKKSSIQKFMKNKKDDEEDDDVD